VRVKVYLVNQGSTEKEEAMLRDLAGNGGAVAALGDGENRGFAAGANLGAQRALADGSDYVLFLNSDAVLQPGTLEMLVAAGGGAVNPRVLDGAGRVWFDAGRVSYRGRGISLRANPEKGPRTVEFVHACILLVHRETFRRVGFFDETLYAYGEDVDFSIRAAKGGIRLVLEARATGVHMESLSVKRVAGRRFRDYYVVRNMILVQRKHRGGAGFALRLVLIFLMELVVPLAYFTVSLQPERMLAVVRGFRDGLTGRSGESPYYPGHAV
jgi:GT2 family glycosyltransferase